jgi:hypothetical protein
MLCEAVKSNLIIFSNYRLFLVTADLEETSCSEQSIPPLFKGGNEK